MAIVGEIITKETIQNHILRTVKYWQNGTLVRYENKPPPILKGYLTETECNELLLLLHELRTRFIEDVNDPL